MCLLLERRITNQRDELHKLNERCRDFSAQMRIIQDIDYYKSRLSKLAPDAPYKAIIANRTFIREIEAIFNIPFDQCLSHYKELLQIRNQIVHKFTHTTWHNDKQYERKFTKKTLIELAEEY